MRRLPGSTRLAVVDGVSASSTTSALCKPPVINELHGVASEGHVHCGRFCTDPVHSDSAGGRSGPPSRTNNFRAVSCRDVAHRGLYRLVPGHVLQCEGVGVYSPASVETKGARVLLLVLFYVQVRNRAVRPAAAKGPFAQIGNSLKV
jgi:hypothetical protein